MKRMIVSGLALLVVLTYVPPANAADEGAKNFTIEVAAGKHNRRQTPVKMTIDLPRDLTNETIARLTGEDGTAILGQLTAPSLLAAADGGDKAHVSRELHFILPALDAGKSAKFKVQLGGKVEAESFTWKDTAGDSSLLSFGERPVLRYMYRALDESTPENRFLTYKVFHHLFDPQGERLVTNGPDGEHPYIFKEILYPHHRGIFFGFNKCSYEGVPKADVWHCQGDDYQEHAGFLRTDAGPVLGRQCVAIAWHGKGKKVFANERRELTVYHVPGGHLIEFASVVESAVGKLTLDGDPQHAGFQFRAHNEVASKTKSQTYYLRPDGKDKPGATRNWPGDKSQVNLPWNAVSIVLGDQRYTAAYLDLPTNPKEARFSERDYARFGSYFMRELDGETPLAVNYRLWFQEGEMTGKQVEALSMDFVEPPDALPVE